MTVKREDYDDRKSLRAERSTGQLDYSIAGSRERSEAIIVNADAEDRSKASNHLITRSLISSRRPRVT